MNSRGRQHHHHNQRPATGVVLVDILVAVVVMGVALAVLVGMAGRAMSSQTQGERLSVASMLADEQLNLVLMVGPEAFSDVYDVEGPCEAPFTEYRYRVEIRGQASGGDPFDVSATILWFESGRQKSITVDTLIAPRGGDEPDPERRPKQKTERDT